MYRSRYKILFLILIVYIFAAPQFAVGQHNEESEEKIGGSVPNAEDETAQDVRHYHHSVSESNRIDITITPRVLDRLRSQGAIPPPSINSTCIRILLHSLLTAMHLQSLSALTFDPASNQIANDSIQAISAGPSQYVLYCNDTNMDAVESSSNAHSDTIRAIILSNIPLNSSYVKRQSNSMTIWNSITAMEYLSWTKSHLTSQQFDEWMQSLTTNTHLDGLKHLDLSNNELTNLTCHMFDRLPDLRALNLSLNLIKNGHIQHKLFLHCLAQLQHLDLSNNKIMSIVYEELPDPDPDLPSTVKNANGDGLFADMPNLHELYLSHNQIIDLPRNAFAALPKLHILNLANNQLSIIPFQVFQTLNQLQHLDLSSNRLVTILDNFFLRNGALTALNLRNNSIDKMLKNSLNGLMHLVELDLSENHITSIDRNAFDSLTSLQQLNLCQNNLTVIPTTLFQRLLQLKYLNLSRNNFKTLPNGIFANQFGLEQLIIDGTSISKLNNWVSRKPHEVKKDVLQQLQIVSLRNNRNLQEIDGITFRSLPAVEQLDLSGNSLRTLPAEIGELKELNYLDISRNGYISLTKQLNTLQRLQTINMLGNSYECDCQMVWLAAWINATRDNADNSTEIDQRPPFNQLNELKCHHGYPGDFLRVLQQLQCFKPTVAHVSESKTHLLRSDAIIECSFTGNPVPDMVWVTPQNKIIPYYSDPDLKPLALNASQSSVKNANHSTNEMANFEHRKKLENHILEHKHINFSMPIGINEVSLLENGSLRVHNISRKDSGLYICYGYNVMGYSSAEVR